MNLGALITEARRRTSDTKLPYQHSDDEHAQAASEGEREACARASLLYDTTSSFCTFAVTAGKAVYELDPLILKVETALFQRTSGGRAKSLKRCGIDWIHRQCDWASRTGCPTHYAIVGNTLRVWPTPTTASVGTLSMSVYRDPLDELRSPGQEPEIPLHHHIGLVDWMVYLASDNRDGELYNPALAAAALNAFEERFGRRHDADTMRRHEEQQSVNTCYGGL